MSVTYRFGSEEAVPHMHVYKKLVCQGWKRGRHSDQTMGQTREESVMETYMIVAVEAGPHERVYKQLGCQAWKRGWC